MAGFRERWADLGEVSGAGLRETTATEATLAAQTVAIGQLLKEGRLRALVLAPLPSLSLGLQGRILSLDGVPVFGVGAPLAADDRPLEVWHGQVDRERTWRWQQAAAFVAAQGEGGELGWIPPLKRRVTPPGRYLPPTGAWSLSEAPTDPVGWLLGDRTYLVEASRLATLRAAGPIVFAGADPVFFRRLEEGVLAAAVFPDFPGLGAQAAEAVAAQLARAEGGTQLVDWTQPMPLIVTSHNLDFWRDLWLRHAR